MEKQGNLQLELFRQLGNSEEARNFTTSKSLFSYVRNYEKAILVVISMIVTGIIFFSLGVEKGKKLSIQKSNLHLYIEKPSGKEKAQEATISAPALPKETIQPPRLEEKQNYVIQLASYKSMSLAQKEAESLKKKGFSPIILTKGMYIVLYVGDYQSKELARPYLSELRKRYKDCYVRRL